MNPSRGRLLPQGQRSFALISVLAMVSLAALTATAFLASARLEKTASMSTGDQTRLTLALDSGYHFGSYPFFRGDNVFNWVDYLIKEDTNGVGYLFHGAPQTNAAEVWSNFPLFSCATLSNIGVSPVNPTSFCVATTNQGGFGDARRSNASPLMQMVNFTSGAVTNIPLLFNRTSPPVAWITNFVTNPANPSQLIPNFRFAYFTEDPSGLVDAERMGGSSTRTTGTNPTEIALAEIGITNASLFASLREQFLTPGLIQQVLQTNNLVGKNVTNPWCYLSSSFYSMNGLKTDKTNRTQGFHRIPRGLGYKQVENTNLQAAKTNLNKLFSKGIASNGALSTIVSVLSKNLTNFGARGGAMASNTYLSNIAANIIDYVDTDDAPTVDANIYVAATNTNMSPVRGVEAIAWPNEVIARFTYTNRSLSGGSWRFPLQFKQYVEVWNLGENSVQVNPGAYEIFNNLRISFQCGNFTANLTNFGSPQYDPFTNAPFKLNPNSYGVMETATRTINILVPAALVPGVTNPPLKMFSPAETKPANQYIIRWDPTGSGTNQIVLDATPAGRWTPNATNLISGGFVWMASSVNFGISSNGAAYNLSGGDPRGGLFVRHPSMDFAANGSDMTPGGRNSHVPGSKGALATISPVLWPDGGHAANTDILSPAFSGNSIPVGARLAGNPKHWIQKTNNSGTLSNVLELGNIFDPIQWADATKGAFNGVDSTGWTNDLTGAATTNPAACGRNTLRIGRPEHPRFAFKINSNSTTPYPNMHMSAAALLDLFCVTPTNPPELNGRYDDGIQINLNTAPPKVLRALAAGVILSNDPALAPTNPFKIPPQAVDNFVTGVTNFRSKYPFYSPSQLAFIGTASNWPNTNNWPAGAVFSTNGIPGISEWNDAAAEEWFSRIYALSKVETRNFRIYVLAQLIKTRGTNTNSASLVYGAVGRRYYDVFNQQNDADNPPSCSVYLLRKVDY